MMPLIIHYLAYCITLLTIFEGYFTNTSLSPLFGVIQTSPSQTTTDGWLDALTTENHHFGRPTLENIYPNGSSLNANQTYETCEQVTKRDDDFVKTQMSQFSLRPSHTSNATSLQQRTFSMPLDLVDSNIGMSTQSLIEDQGSSSTNSQTIHTLKSSVTNEVKLDRTTTSKQTIQVFTGSTQTSVSISGRKSSSRSTAFSFESEKSLLHKCQELDTFFRSFKLCENHDSGDPSRSCKGRCGQTQSLDHSFDNCSCDDKCVVYNDCCVDFYVHCNQTFQQSVQLHGQKLFSYRSHRHYSEVTAIFSCSKTDVTNSRIRLHASTAPTATSPPNTSLPYHGRMASLTFLNNLVADLSTGLIYNHVNAYYSCIPKSGPDPFVIPLVLPLKGRYIYGQSIESYVFPTSLSKYTPYILNPFPTMRGSFSDETVECGSCPIQRVNYFCGAVITNEEVPWLKDYSAYSSRLSFDPLNKLGNCSHWPSMRGGVQFWMTYVRTVLGITTHFLKPSPLYSWTATRQKLESQSPDTVGTVTIRRRLREKSLDLEFTGAPWSRMRCPHSNLPLDECQILQCSQGYFWTETGKCWVPSSVLVSAEANDSNTAASGQSQRLFAPFCYCLIAYKVINSLQFYELGEVYIDEKECRIPVAGVYIHTLVSNETQQNSVRKTSKTQGEESDLSDMVGNIHQDFVEYLDNTRKSGNINNDQYNITDLERALLKGLIEIRHQCTEKFSKLKIVFADGVSDSDSHRISFSYAYDDIYADVSQEKSPLPNHPANNASKGTGHNHKCEIKSLVLILVIFVVAHCSIML